MVWNVVIPSVISAGVAIVAVGYGAYLSAKREMLNWTRDQRTKAYAELLAAIEGCYAAFLAIAEIVSLMNYTRIVRKEPRIIEAKAEWKKWSDEVDKRPPPVELIASNALERFIVIDIRLGRNHHESLLAELDSRSKVDFEKWYTAASGTRTDLSEIRRRFRRDITYIDRVPTLLRTAIDQILSLFYYYQQRIKGHGQKKLPP